MTPKIATTAELAWGHPEHDIPASGLSARREATTEELAWITSALDLIACTSLSAQYTLTPTAGGHYQLSGRLHAELNQACVVTLEPVASTLDEAFEAVFWPQEDMPAPHSGELALDDEPEREVIVAGQIAVGRVVFESLAAAINPFPRQPGAVLDLPSPTAAGSTDGKPESPFAVLANLKAKD